MPPDYNGSLDNLRTLIAKTSNEAFPHRNEATTRLQLIDELLFSCLGWDKSQCVAEDRLDGKYTDYSLGTPQVTLVIEAKREEVSFTLPAGYNNLTYRIQRFRKEAPDVLKAIEQAMAYCHSRGVPYGAVCSGHQIVAFLASRTDGISPHRGKALVLTSLGHMADNFRVLWDCLSSSGVYTHGLPVFLRETERRPPPDKLSVRIPKYPRYRNRNSIQTNLQIFGELIIEDVRKLPDSEEAFLRACYTESGALSQYALVSRSILQSRYSDEFEKSLGGPSLVPATTKKGELAITSEMLAQSATKRPVLLIGDVGVGKTMFVRHFIAVEAADILRTAIVLYLDMGIKPTLESHLDGYIEAEFARQLFEDYSIDVSDRRFVHGVYNLDLTRFKRGIYGGLRRSNPIEYEKQQILFLESLMADTNEHLRRCLVHISKGQNRQIIIFLDNVDQRPHEFQQRAFLIGQSIAELWPAFVFVALRPDTYHRSRLEGTLSAYHAKAFVISPPRIDRVIGKRLQYAIGLLERGVIGRSIAGVDIRVDLDDLLDYLKIVNRSFKSNDELVEFVDNVCGGNIRLALEFIQVFVGSGHANTTKMLDIYRKERRYRVALHEFLRAVIYGDYRDYDPRFSEITNLFDISGMDGREHFLAPILLAYLELEARATRSSGYVSVSQVYNFSQNAGFQPTQIGYVLGRLFRNKLIETETREPIDEYSQTRGVNYRITTIGSYYYQRLIGMFTYVDAMIVDTPIIDRSVRQKINDEYTILGRLERAEEFRRYLDSQWSNMQGLVEGFDWSRASSQLEHEMVLIRGRVSS